MSKMQIEVVSRRRRENRVSKLIHRRFFYIIRLYIENHHENTVSTNNLHETEVRKKLSWTIQRGSAKIH